MSELIIENERPPDYVMDDIRSLRNRVKVKRLRVETGPNDGWTLNFEDKSDEHDFDAVASLIEDTVSSDDVRTFYDLEGKAHWLIQVRYQ